MDKFDDLMQRLVEIQSSETRRSPELIAEDERLMEDLKNLAKKTSANCNSGSIAVRRWRSQG